MVTIKRFSADMQADVVRFLTQVFPESGKAFDIEGRHASFADVECNYIGFWCAVDDDKIIGTVGVKKLSDTLCELKAMYLYRKYQGQGIGRRLAETAVSFAQDTGFECMVLDTVSTYENALALYKKVGFRETERYNDNERADVFMMKRLDGAVIREITNEDFDGLMRLYTELHNNPIPEKEQRVMEVWESVLADKNHHIIIAEADGYIVASCVCVIIPNLTHGQRPYAFVENVVTSAEFRRKGLATACLDYARELAVKENCYKMMLMTGSKEEGTLRFYENAGYNRNDKTAFIQWL